MPRSPVNLTVRLHDLINRVSSLLHLFTFCHIELSFLKFVLSTSPYSTDLIDSSYRVSSHSTVSLSYIVYNRSSVFSENQNRFPPSNLPEQRLLRTPNLNVRNRSRFKLHSLSTLPFWLIAVPSELASHPCSCLTGTSSELPAEWRAGCVSPNHPRSCFHSDTRCHFAVERLPGGDQPTCADR